MTQQQQQDKPVVHSVTTRTLNTGRYVAKCACGEESNRSTYKPLVDAWRKRHYLQVRNIS